MSVDLNGVPEVQQLLAELGGIYPKVTYRAINKSLDKTKTAISAAIREQVNLSAKYVRDRLGAEYANALKLNGKVKTEKRGILLSRYDPNQLLQSARSPIDTLTGRAALSDSSSYFAPIPAGKKLKQVSIKISTRGSRKKYKLFPILLQNSNAIGLAVRTGRRKKDFKMLYGPSISQVFNTLKDSLEQDASAEFLLRFEAQLNYELERLR